MIEFILQRLNLRVKGYGQSAALVKLKHAWGQLTSGLNVLLQISGSSQAVQIWTVITVVERVASGKGHPY